MNKIFENKKICSKCGGECCKTLPGSAHPDDFDMENGPSKLIAALNSGKWCFDYWEGDARKGEHFYLRTYFVRPAIKGLEGEVIDATWGGECTFLTESGCSIKNIEDRPHECRFLEPLKRQNCIQHGNTKCENSVAWLKYRKEISKIIRELY